MINKYLSVLLMMLALTIRPEHVAAQDFLLTIRVQTPAVDDGRPLGSLFDIVEANGNVVAAAGFESNTQSTAIGNTRAVQFYLGSNYSDETTYQVTSLPAPFLDSSGQPNNAAMFRMMSYQGQLIAYPYSPTLKVARVIGPGASSWRDFFHPALSSSTSPNLATDSVRFLQVVGNDLLAAYSKKLRYGKSIVDVQFPAPYSSGSQITLLSAGGYYGGRLYLVGQSNVANCVFRPIVNGDFGMIVNARFGGS